ncbi:hypothetical protein RG47T_5174 [Mucilaginibacter polytrichastri]|uniref:Uncharacterized protein n=1 Tax=Mucilaginibacter polytrichastri TaxID=1302689 RepID=A0A1Q6A6R4_9SPHI|nr:hypothetical protein RG47T_5174 [Mucilaginibacter polytrichastri]
MESILKRNNVNVIGNGDQVMLFAYGFGCDQKVTAIFQVAGNNSL